MSFEQCLLNLQRIAVRDGHRQLLWLNGEQQWCYSQLQSIGESLCTEDSIFISSKRVIDQYFTLNTSKQLCQQQINTKDTVKHLGREYSCIVFDAFAGFNPDHFAQIIGALTFGGVIVLITPSEQQWPQWQDPETTRLVAPPYLEKDVKQHFLAWVLACLKGYVRENKHNIYSAHIDSSKLTPPQSDQSLTLSQTSALAIHSRLERTKELSSNACKDQQELVARAAEVLSKTTSCYLVIMAARGRGKSAALGLLANKLLNRTLYLTASNHMAVTQVQAFASNKVTYYSLLDLLSLEPSKTQGAVLLVDEAASINIDVLSRVVNKFKQVVFATTTQGYEGTGQGFKLRFLEYLKKKEIPLEFLSLQQPIRWLSGDHLEKWTNKLLLTESLSETDKYQQSTSDSLYQHKDNNNNQENTQKNIRGCPAPALSKQVLAQKVDIVKVQPQDLIKDHEQLQQLYTLLSQAHYRTTPSDLRIILDSPNIHIWVASINQKIVAACLVASEGAVGSFPVDAQGMDGESLAQAMFEGTRRPKGNLLPQILIGQEGFLAAKNYTFARVMRVATDQRLRRLQLASSLLNAVEDWCQLQAIDYLGASFAMQNDLLNFWQKNRFSLVRIGSERDKITASFSCVVLKVIGVDRQTQGNRPLDVRELLDRLINNFQYKLGYQQQKNIELSSAQFAQFNHLSMPSNTPQVQLCARHYYHRHASWCLKQLYSFAHHFKPLESVDYILHAVLSHYTQCWQGDVLAAKDNQLLKLYIFEHSQIDDIYQTFNLSGYRSLVTQLRRICRIILKHINEMENGSN